MPKHATPKAKKGLAKRKKRYGSFKTKVLKRLSNEAKLVDCPNCKAKRKSHTVCHECGQYRGRQVIDKQKEVEKITTIKA